MAQLCKAPCNPLNKKQKGHFGCAVCGRAFDKWSNLIVHLRTHSGEELYECDQCDKAFAQRFSLSQHRRTHARVKRYKCGRCGKVFVHYSNLQRHERTPHPIAEPLKNAKKRSCSTTTVPPPDASKSSTAQATPFSLAVAHGNVTMSPMAASLMGAMVHSYAPNNDSISSKWTNSPQSSSPSALTSHLRPYGDYVDATAAQQHHKRHSSNPEQDRIASTHTIHACQNVKSTHKTDGLAPGPSASARMEVNLSNEHEQTRGLVGEKSQLPAKDGMIKMRPYECISCHQVLTGKCALRAHYKTHPVAERPWKCKVCGQALSSEHGLKAHTKMHTRGRPFGRWPTYLTAVNLKTHVRVDRLRSAVHGTTMGADGLLKKPLPVQPAFLSKSIAESSVAPPILSPNFQPPTTPADLPGAALLYARDLLNFPSRLAVPTTSSFVHRPHTTNSDEKSVAPANVPAATHNDSIQEQRPFNLAANSEQTTEVSMGIAGLGSHALPRNGQHPTIVSNEVEDSVNEASVDRTHPSIQPTELVPPEALASLADSFPVDPLLRAPKQEPDEDVDVELLEEPPVIVREHRSSCTSSSTNTPSLPTLAASSSLPNSSVPLAYFGDAVYDRQDDPSSFTYESDFYGRFKFVLLDEVEKEERGQLSIVRLYQCEACLTLSQTHKYKDEVVHTIMTSGQRIVKCDPATPRGILHLCVRHRRSIDKHVVGRSLLRRWLSYPQITVASYLALRNLCSKFLL